MELFALLFSTAFICLIPVTSSTDDAPVRECGGQDVCTTLMRYKDGTTVDEGDYCYCKAGFSTCSKEWDDSDEAALTWQHYERAHWTVQYRFCTPVFHERNVCAPGEMAAVVETDVKKWAPYVSNPRCLCENDVTFKIMGWKREGAVWKYFYHCEKDECASPSDTLTGVSVCAKIYVDTNKYDDKVKEVKFLCNCPDGYLCPAKYDDKEDSKNLTHDEGGSYVPKKCVAAVQQKVSSV